MLRRSEWIGALCLGGALLLAGCAGVSATPTNTPTSAPTAAPASATLPPAATSTARPSSTPAPTDTPADTATPAPTSTATATASQPPRPSATANSTNTATTSPLPTRAPVTITPLGPPETAPLMSTTGGPAGYASTIQCQRAGAVCAPVMPPGDISFRLSLAGDVSAPWTHFINYGLAVEKDGANVSGLFMFVDAGWLQPGTVVGFGASRNFSQPGAYVIRSSGCLTTDTKSSNCSWATIAGDVVTFRIQP